jgi:hypothetical protein
MEEASEKSVRVLSTSLMLLHSPAKMVDIAIVMTLLLLEIYLQSP